MGKKSLIKLQEVVDAMELLADQASAILEPEETDVIPNIIKYAMEKEKLEVFKNFFVKPFAEATIVAVPQQDQTP